MAWRGLHISQAVHLSLDKRRIKVRLLEEDDGEPLFFAIEDVAWVILDNARSTLSARMISACMEGGTPIIISDQRHLPCGMALPFHQHYAQTQVSRLQIAVSTPLKKRIWARIVKTKIKNQAQNLVYQQNPGSNTLKEMVRHVQSGDPKNVEARAARYYWSQLFENFTRADEGDVRNAMLNYSYACVRGVIARALVATGFIPSIGLHHDGVQNPFNLADDLMEPFRPVADQAVIENLADRVGNDHTLGIEDRRSLVAVLGREVIVDNQQLSLLNAAELAAESLRAAMEENRPSRLLFPVGW